MSFKPSGMHPHNALTAVRIRGLKKPGRYADGNGLYLQIDPSGNKRWIVRVTVGARRRDMGLGNIRNMPLADARDATIDIHRKIRAGIDPIRSRLTDAMRQPTFAEFAVKHHNQRRSEWKNGKHQDQWINTLQTYAFPVFGNVPIDQIDGPLIRRALEPIWHEKHETARRVKQRIGNVLDAAEGVGYRDGSNPATNAMRGLGKPKGHGGHHKAMPHSGVPSFYAAVSCSGMSPSGKNAFKFLLLTAARTSEVLEARWDEIDFDKRVWCIPAERMKMEREHVVPLSDQAVALLRAQMEQIADGNEDCSDDFIFPGNKPGKPLSNMTFLQQMRRMELEETPHGFRSSFKDWAMEQTSYSNEVSERALAHVSKNKVEAAYFRSDLREAREGLMADWANYIGGESK